MDKVTVYDSWRNGLFERYVLKNGKKIILEREENCQPPFVKVVFVDMEWPKAGAARSAEESSSEAGG